MLMKRMGIACLQMSTMMPPPKDAAASILLVHGDVHGPSGTSGPREDLPMHVKSTTHHNIMMNTTQTDDDFRLPTRSGRARQQRSFTANSSSTSTAPATFQASSYHHDPSQSPPQATRWYAATAYPVECALPTCRQALSSRAEADNHIRVLHQARWSCHHCRDSFEKAQSAIAHEEKHRDIGHVGFVAREEDGKIPCPNCNLWYSGLQGLQAHRRSKHREVFNEELRPLQEQRRALSPDRVEMIATLIAESSHSGRRGQELVDSLAASLGVEVRTASYYRYKHPAIKEAVARLMNQPVLPSTSSTQPAATSEAEPPAVIRPVFSQPARSRMPASSSSSSSSSVSLTQVETPRMPAAQPLDYTEVIRQAIDEQLNDDSDDPMSLAAKTYVYGVLRTKDVSFGYQQFSDKVAPPTPRRERRPPAGTPVNLNSAQRKRQEYRENQNLWKKNRGRLVSAILNDMPLNPVLPRKTDINRVYSARLSKESCEDNAPFTPKPCPNPDQQMKPISVAEVQAALDSYNGQSAPGPDLDLDVLKLKEVKAPVWRLVFNAWLLFRQLPAQLKKCRSLLIPKKADGLDDVNNWRPLTIGSLVRRLYTKVLDARLVLDLNKRQKAFIKADGCAELTTVLASVMRDARSRRKRLNVMWLDLSKAFDSVSHHSIFRALQRHNAHPGFIEIIKDMYSGSTTSFTGSDGATDQIEIKSGIMQGCCISPKLFNAVVDELLDDLEDAFGYTLNGTKVNSICFADDLCLISNTDFGMGKLLQSTRDFFVKRGLQVNPKKSVSASLVPTANRGAIKVRTEPTWEIDGNMIKALDVTETTRYLGSHFDAYGNRIACMEHLDGYLHRLKKCRLKPQQKIIILRTYVTPKVQAALLSSDCYKGMLKLCDTKIRRAAKDTLHLPHSVQTNWFYVPVKNGGLGFQDLASQVPLAILTRHVKMTNTNDPLVAAAYGGDGVNPSYWQRYAARAATWLGLREPPRTQQAISVLKQSVPKDHHRLFAATQQGIGHDMISKFPHGNQWLWGYGRTPGQDYVNGVKLLTNNLPCLTNLRRGAADPTVPKRCRLCKTSNESQLHILQLCPMMKDAIIHRHDKTLARLEESLRSKGYQVEHEPRFRDANGRLHKPDVIVVKDERAVVLDLQVAYEKTPDVLDKRWRDKADKYLRANINAQINQRLGTNDVKYGAVIVGSRGSWCKLNDEMLQFLSLNNSQFKRQLCQLALSGTLSIWRWFRRKVFDPGKARPSTR